MVRETIRIYCRLKPIEQSQRQKRAVERPSSLGGHYNVSTSSQQVDGDSNGDVVTFALPKEQQVAVDGAPSNRRDEFGFLFHKVFDVDVSQDAVFDVVSKPVIDRVVDGYNCTIFAYGQTGSGKTYTMTGGAERYADRGIIPRALSYIFQARQTALADADDVTISISYLEIYQEVGFDLLDPRHDRGQVSRLEDLPRVSILEDSSGNIHLKNLSNHVSVTEEEALNLLFVGDTNRAIAETPMNQASTRSHCIFTIHLSVRRASMRRYSKLHLVDLAGSERVGKSGVTGLLLAEAKYINLSLHHLEQVIVALSEPNRQHVPYRNSLLTSVLRDSLGGNCLTRMVATCATDRLNLLETISTCRFAQRVAQVKNEALVNEEADPTAIIAKLRRELQETRDQLSLLAPELQCSGPLSDDDMEKCSRLTANFVDAFDGSVFQGLPVDMRMIQYCFQLVKRHFKNQLLQQQQQEQKVAVNQIVAPPRPTLTDRELAALRDPTAHLPVEVTKLKEVVEQRDNEIAVLVQQLHKEREKTRTIIGRSKHQQNGSATSRTESSSSIQQPSPAKILDAEHRDNLKAKYTEAKLTGEKLQQARANVAAIKSKLTSSTSDEEESRQLRQRLSEQSEIYRVTFERLRTLKTEIEHLHHLVVVSQAAASTQQRSTNHHHHQEEEEEGGQNDNVAAQLPMMTATLKISEHKQQSEQEQPIQGIIAPTGDAQVDENIAAFLRARQAFMSRMANSSNNSNMQ